MSSHRAGSDCVDDYLEEIRGTWESDDPTVLVWDFDAEPVVADVDGELRYISSNLVYASTVTREGLIHAINERGEPRVGSLSEHSHRFDKEDLEDLPPKEEADDT